MTPQDPRAVMPRRRALALGLLAWAGGAAAHEGSRDDDAPPRMEQKPWGIAGRASDARRTVRIEMLDSMRFTPDRIEVRRGETVVLETRNTGKVLHELVLGTKDELDAHARMMAKHPGMEHDEPYMIHVKPGRSGRIVWHFNRSGSFHFACLLPGHYTAGMVGIIHVTEA